MSTNENILTLPGVMADYSFSRTDNALVISNKNSDEVIPVGEYAQVQFSDGRRVDLQSERATGIAASAERRDSSPSMTALIDGGHVLVWESDRAENEAGIQVQRYAADGTLLQETRIVAEEAADPTVTELADSTFIVAWASEAGSTSYIHTQRFDAQGNKSGTQVVVASSTVVALDDAVIQVLANGSYVVSWLVERETRTATSDDWLDGADGKQDGYQSIYPGDLYLQLYKADGTRIGGQQKIFAGEARYELDDQMILPTSDGGFLMAWTTRYWSEQEGTYKFQLQVQAFNAGGVAQGTARVLQSVDDPDGYPAYFSLAAAGDGYVVSWIGDPQDAYGRTVLVQRYDASLDPVGQVTVVTPSSYSVNGASTTSLSDGGYLVTWADYVGQGWSYTEVLDEEGNVIGVEMIPQSVPGTVYAQRFNADGSKEGTEITVATLPDAQHIMDTPVAVGLKDGGFVVSWEGFPQGEESSEDDDDIDLDLYALRFDRDGKPLGEVVTTLTGDDGDNTLAWTDSSKVILQGGSGNDTLAGGSADDELDGGNGTDTAVFAGNMSDHVLGQAEDGRIVVTSSQQGTDLLSSIEQLQFADGTLHIEDGRHSPEVGNDHLSMEPAAAALEDGGHVIAWLQDDDVRLQRYDKTGDLLRETVLEFGSAENVDVAAFGNGFISAVTDGDQLYVQPFAADGTTTDVPQVITPGKVGASIEDPALIALKDGSYAIVWVEIETEAGEYAAFFDDYDILSAQVHVQRFSENHEALGEPIAVEALASSRLFAANPGLAALDNGGFVVTWERDTDGRELDVYLQRFSANGSKDGSAIRVNSSTAADQFGADVTTLADGSHVVTWVSQAYKNDRPVTGNVFMQRYKADGSKLGVETRVNTSNEVYGEPAITALKGGGYVITWATSDEAPRTGDARLYAQIFDNNGAKVGKEILVARDQDDLFPTINATDDGGFVITWEDLRTEWLSNQLVQYGDIHSQRFDANGNALVIQGDEGNNTLAWTGSAAVSLIGGQGSDTLIGGKGSDTAVYDGKQADYTISREGVGKVRVTHNASGDQDDLQDIEWLRFDDVSTYVGFNAADTVESDVSRTLGSQYTYLILGGLANINGTGNALDNTLLGNDGANRLDGKAGADTLQGGTGNDTYVLDNPGDIIIEKADEGIDSVESSISWILGDHLENLTLTGAALEGTGNALDNMLTGNAAANRLEGGAGNDILDGKGGADTLIGGADDDTYIVDSLKDGIIERAGEGTDTVQASVNWTLGEHLENLTLTGRASINGTGNDGNNALTGNDGNNILDGGEGADDMRGGKGNDTYVVDDAADKVIELDREGTDTVRASISYSLTDNVENLILNGSEHINGTGNALKNILTGNDGNNRLDGGADVDRLIGGKGDDTYIVDLVVKGKGKGATLALADTIVEKANEGSDTLQLRIDDEAVAALAEASKVTTLTLAAQLENLDASGTGTLALNLTGNAADNVLTGNDGDNILNGGAGNDVLYGGAGNDILIGGLGADTLTGGAGNDIFRFTSVRDTGLAEGSRDVVSDFVSGEDQLDFSALKGWKFVGEEAFTGARQLRYEVIEGEGDQVKVILYGNVNANPDAEFAIELQGIGSLQGTDFIF